MSQDWILHQDKSWLLVDKPAGLSVHNEPGQDLVSLFTQTLGKPVAPIFRLDQETSGLILLSQSSEATSRWHQALSRPATSKEYLCIVKGPESSAGTWDSPLTDKAEGRQNPQGLRADRKPCLTHYSVCGQNQYFSELLCRIETGRQHQIRKHAALARHPIVGDNRYGDKKYNLMISERYQFARMALHAYRLRCHFDGKDYDWVSPRPSEFSKLLAPTDSGASSQPT